jgi:hypothetical protein
METTGREAREGLDDSDDDLTDRAREKGGESFAGKVLSDLARRALMTGIGAVFMSEDSLRGALTDMKLPKEAMAYVLGQADRTKRELIATIARETRSFLNTLELEKVISRVLSGTTLEIHTRIRISPGPDGTMGVKLTDTETSVKRTRGPLSAEGTTDAPDDDEDINRRVRRRGSRAKPKPEEEEPEV